jgi:3-phenylpropionate/cinnamic acid dioxygenase small subunit
MTAGQQESRPLYPEPGERGDAALHFEVEQLYFDEAELLDEGLFGEWFDLLADDLDYWMPRRTNRTRRQQSLAVHARGEVAFYDETKESLEWRIRRFDSGSAWSEDPPSRTRHYVTNVVVRHVSEKDPSGFTTEDLLVRSNLLVNRSRLEREENIYSGKRTDVLRRTAEGLKIARRTVVLDLHTLQAKNLSTFF